MESVEMSEPEILVRSARREDADLIAKFNSAMAWETEQKRLSADVVSRGVSALFDRQGAGVYFVAEVQARVVACLMVTYEWSDWRNGQFWWIQSVYVHPDYRRQGVFRALYNHVARVARKDPEVCGLRLYVERDNRAAQATYEQLGMDATPYLIFESEFRR